MSAPLPPELPRISPDLSTLSFAPDDLDSAFLKHPSPALIYDPETARIIAANEAAQAMYGWTVAELESMTLDDIRPPDQRDDLRAVLARLRSDGGSAWFSVVHWRRDGERIDVEALSQPMRLEGRPVRRAVMIDVTARTRAEAMFRGVAEQSLTGIYVIQDGKFRYLNPRLAEMFGYSVEEVLAHPDPLGLLSTGARALADQQSANRLAGKHEAVRYTMRSERRDGSPIAVEIYGTSLTLRGRPALLGTVLDVTERLSAEAALRESESRFRAAFDQAMNGMALTAPDGRWLRVNPALCEMLGRTSDEMTSSTFQAMTHPDDVEVNVALKDALLRGEIPGYRMDKRFIHQDGSIIWVSLNVSLVRDEAGSPLYMVAQMNDVTAQKRAEAALHESEGQLRHAQKMEAVGRLAGGVAHDFNNLLTVIGSNADLGASLAAEGRAAPVEFAEIRAAVDRAASLTRQLLAFSRRQVLAPESISLNAVVTDAERMLRRVIGEDIALSTDLASDTGHVVADRGQLEQVLMNLVVNARDAMPDGGEIVIRTRQGDGQILLSVSDTGIGMDEETAARAFEPFFTTKALGKGTGLGLSTVYGIAQQSGGDVEIHSAPGDGTTVVLTLPESAREGASSVDLASEGAVDPAEESRGETILLVEDEAAVRAVARRLLERFGYEVIEAANGADALFLWSMHRARVRLVLTDAVMPLMGGRELAERLNELGADIPILFMSGYADGERGGEVPAGANLLGKPFSAETLGATVTELLGRPRR